MALYLLLSFAASVVPLPAPPLLIYAAAGLLSLMALAWPLLRGVPWHQVRQDVGLTLGRSPALEPVLGLAGYAMSIPCLGLGFVISLSLMHLRERISVARGLAPPEPPSHPVFQMINQMDWRVLVQLLLLASVSAPVVEETMFRGVLYRHLREATGKWGKAISIVCSALLVSFLFAVIHPQGWVLVPALMGLAFGFSLVREWRGTLVPCILAHAVHNGLLVCLLYLALVS
jgi:membrane protease YdiL (CAAX protease family)